MAHSLAHPCGRPRSLVDHSLRIRDNHMKQVHSTVKNYKCGCKDLSRRTVNPEPGYRVDPATRPPSPPSPPSPPPGRAPGNCLASFQSGDRSLSTKETSRNIQFTYVCYHFRSPSVQSFLYALRGASRSAPGPPRRRRRGRTSRGPGACESRKVAKRSMHFELIAIVQCKLKLF